MFVIGNFFLILNLMLLIILINFFYQSSYKKEFIYSCLNYFSVNLIHIFAANTINSFRTNTVSFVDYILILSGLFYLYYQYYYFQIIVFFITKKKVRVEKKIVFFIIVIIISIRFFIKLKKFINSDNLIVVASTTFLTVKMLFVAMLVVYIIFIFLYIIPTIVFLYNNYLLIRYRKSVYFKFLRFLCMIFIVKIILEFMQAIFLDYLRFFLQNTSFFYIVQKMQHDSDVMITFLSVYIAPILHIQFLLFLNEHSRVVHMNKNYVAMFHGANQEFDKEIPFALKELKNIFVENYTIYKLIELYIFKEICTILNCDIQDCVIVENNSAINAFDNDLYFESDIFLSYIKTNQILSYDYLCDFFHAAEMIEIESGALFEYEFLMNYCIEKNIKLAINLSRNDIYKVEKILIVKLNEKTELIDLNEKKIHNIIHVVKVYFSMSRYHFLFDIKKKFEYINSIDQANLIEQKKMYEMRYRKIKNNFLESKLISYFVSKGRVRIKNQMDSSYEKYLKEVHERIYEIQKYSQDPYLSRYVYKNKECIVVSFYPIAIEKNKHSIHLILSGVKLLNNAMIPISDENNIELLFQINNKKIKEAFVSFYSQLQYSYNIKIIIVDNFDHVIMKKVLKFAILEYALERIDLKDKIFSDDKIINLLNQMFNDKNKIFLIYDIFVLPIEKQKYFFYEYSLFSVKNKKNKIKVFFIVPNFNLLEEISKEIVSVSIVLKSPSYIVSDFSNDDMNDILYNFNFYLFQNKFDRLEIEYYFSRIFSYKGDMDMYDFIEFFFKFIESKILENLYSNDIEEILYGLQVGKKALKNYILMYKLKRICGHSNTKLACLLGVDRSMIVRYFAKAKKE